MTAPEGCVVNCSFPAAVAARMQVGHFMTEMVFRALSPQFPIASSPAAAALPPRQTSFTAGGTTGNPVHHDHTRGRNGRQQFHDGHHCAIFPANGANTPVEIFESDTPLMVEENAFCLIRADQGRNAEAWAAKWLSACRMTS